MASAHGGSVSVDARHRRHRKGHKKSSFGMPVGGGRKKSSFGMPVGDGRKKSRSRSRKSQSRSRRRH